MEIAHDCPGDVVGDDAHGAGASSSSSMNSTSRISWTPPYAAFERRLNYTGPALFSYGFRPLFLGGAVWSAACIVLWIPQFMGDLSWRTAYTPLDWHIHEMLYGYVAAVIAGFLLTAIPNWTGRLPITMFDINAMCCERCIATELVSAKSTRGVHERTFVRLETITSRRAGLHNDHARSCPIIGSPAYSLASGPDRRLSPQVLDRKAAQIRRMPRPRQRLRTP
jgi:hypothetical protein